MLLHVIILLTRHHAYYTSFFFFARHNAFYTSSCPLQPLAATVHTSKTAVDLVSKEAHRTDPTFERIFTSEKRGYGTQVGRILQSTKEAEL